MIFIDENDNLALFYQNYISVLLAITHSHHSKFTPMNQMSV